MAKEKIAFLERLDVSGNEVHKWWTRSDGGSIFTSEDLRTVQTSTQIRNRGGYYWRNGPVIAGDSQDAIRSLGFQPDFTKPINYQDEPEEDEPEDDDDLEPPGDPF